MSYYDKAKDIYDMSAQGKMLDAFEKYYHKDVVMVEATGEARKGKDANRKFELEYMVLKLSRPMKKMQQQWLNHGWM
jgi:ketosteroid isomerase-like protein